MDEITSYWKWHLLATEELFLDSIWALILRLTLRTKSISFHLEQGKITMPSDEHMTKRRVVGAVGSGAGIGGVLKPFLVD
jgi:hypothetical protein